VPPAAATRSASALRVLVPIVAAGAALRFSTLDLQSYWYDEAVTVGLLHLDLGSLLDRIPDSESTPPLYYVLAWLWSRPFGTGEVGLRSLSALLGTASIPVFWLAARELVSERAALLVAALGAFSPILVWYSQEARAYALVVLLGALSVLYFARALRDPRPASLAGWAVSSALALTAHYFAGFLVLPEAIWLLARARNRRAAALAVALPVVAGLAMLPIALHQQSLDLASYIGGQALLPRLARVPKQMLVGFDAPLETLLSIFAGVVAVAGAAVALRRADPGVRIAAALAAIVIAIPLVLGAAGFDYLTTRNVLPVWLPAATVVAAGLAAGRAGAIAAAALCAIGVAAVVGVDVTPLWQRDDWRGVARSLGPAPASRAIVLTPVKTGVVPFLAYAPRTEGYPAAGARVRQVAVVSTPDRSGEDVHPPGPPRPPTPQPLLPGFHVVRRDFAPSYTVVLLEAARPMPMATGPLTGLRLLQQGPALLLQRP
jgi:mannosyltransferase